MNAVDVDKEPLPRHNEPGVETCYIHMCTACLRGKRGLTPTLIKTSTPNPDYTDVIKNDDLLPGDTVIISQYEYRFR